MCDLTVIISLILVTSLTQPERHLKHKVRDGGVRAETCHKVQDEEGGPAHHEGREHLQDKIQVTRLTVDRDKPYIALHLKLNRPLNLQMTVSGGIHSQ